MAKYYTDEKNVQIIIALLKEYGIRKVIASPGTTNMAFVGSIQNDPYFEMYSSVDERSAAYMACGLAAESGETVVLSCTGATASRNYLPGLTEAYYRKLPVLAITSTQNTSRVGHHIAQIIDRSSIQNDVARFSVTLPTIKDNEDLVDCEIKVNKALLELKRQGGGPVHINLTTSYNKSYNTKDLPKVRVIERITPTDKFPELKGKVAIFVGSHKKMPQELTSSIDRFCTNNNAVVFCDHTSGYKGKYRVLYSLVAGQRLLDISAHSPEVLIHIGEVTGDYSTLRIVGNQVWRVSEDGEIRDTFGKLRYVFEMAEKTFFDYFSENNKVDGDDSYLKFCNIQLQEAKNKIPELPFSNIWLASQMAHRIPEGSVIHFGILNSLRSWNFFELPLTVSSSSNVGGFGIDGNVSSLLGASLANKDKLYFGVFGDLAFFYDLNAIGNRHKGNNLRILLVNNGKGTEFRQFNHLAASFDTDADEFIAAAGHYGNKSQVLVKHYAEDLGFEYLSASNKNEFEQVYQRFLIPEITDKPIFLEVFTNNLDESEALKAIVEIEEDVKSKAKDLAMQVLGESGKNVLKKFMRR